MIKAIIFDCFGVLTADTWREFCDSLPPGPAVQKARELNHQYDSRKITKDEFVRGVYEVTGQQFQHVESLLDNETTKNIELLEYIRELHAKGYKLSILSNVGTSWIRDTLLTSDEKVLFDDMLLSFEVGMTKPDPRIFRLAAKRLHVEPNECIFIDDVERYCAAAKEQGMLAVYYQNFNQMRAEIDKILSHT